MGKTISRELPSIGECSGSKKDEGSSWMRGPNYLLAFISQGVFITGTQLQNNSPLHYTFHIGQHCKYSVVLFLAVFQGRQLFKQINAYFSKSTLNYFIVLFLEKTALLLQCSAYFSSTTVSICTALLWDSSAPLYYKCSFQHYYRSICIALLWDSSALLYYKCLFQH